jgi:hypothetical protein
VSFAETYDVTGAEFISVKVGMQLLAAGLLNQNA